METRLFNPNNFISVTEPAKQHLLNQIKQNDALGIALGIMPNGCAGFEYTWNFVSEYYSQNYKITHIDDSVLIVDLLSADLLEGSEVDLVDEGIKGKTLIVRSPKATGACGCGESVTFNI